MDKIEQLIESCEDNLKDMFKQLEKKALINQERVLEAFKKYRISYRHFSGTTGYGYDDVGRDTLSKVFADLFGTESAIVSPLITCGSHADALTILGILYQRGKKMLSITGKPYDTLDEVIFGKEGEDIGSLKDLGVEYYQIDFKDGKLDETEILKQAKELKPDLIFMQRSRGYNWRDPLSIDDIEDIIAKIKTVNKDAYIMVDNCYGGFMDIKEPTAVGADVAIGSLIKNMGGGLAPTGAYIAGKKKIIDMVSHRLTSPSLGLEVGSYAYGYQQFYQGVFMAPHTILQGLKGCLLMSSVMRELGYNVLPKPNQLPLDVITSIELKDPKKLVAFCQAIQASSPIDSFVSPEPWDMPGYTTPIIMAAGTFNQGSTIELSCDAPMRDPYILYLQGGLTYEHVKIALRNSIKNIDNF